MQHYRRTDANQRTILANNLIWTAFYAADDMKIQPEAGMLVYVIVTSIRDMFYAGVGNMREKRREAHSSWCYLMLDDIVSMPDRRGGMRSYKPAFDYHCTNLGINPTYLREKILLEGYELFLPDEKPDYRDWHASMTTLQAAVSDSVTAEHNDRGTIHGQETAQNDDAHNAAAQCYPARGKGSAVEQLRSRLYGASVGNPRPSKGFGHHDRKQRATNPS